MTFLMRNFPIQSPKHIPKLSSFCCMLVVKLKEKMENVAQWFRGTKTLPTFFVELDNTIS
jgi:hypothetical protein